jgi:uncharacterized protein YfkK (UPF0435 family)
MQNAITILSLVIAIISGLTGILWSTRYKASKQAEMDAKDAEFNAKEAKLKLMLKSNDEQIHLLKLNSSPMIAEWYSEITKTLNEINDELFAEVEDLKNANETLLKQVQQVITSDQRFSESIPGLAVPEDVRSSLSAFINGSEKIIIDVGQSVYNILLIGENIKRNAEKISKVTTTEIDISKPEIVTGSDRFDVEIPDADRDESQDDNEDPTVESI